MPNKYETETRSLIRALKKAGATMRKVSDGEESEDYQNENQAVETLTCTDEGYLYITTPEGDRCTLYLVLGNGPGELVCDYSWNEWADKVLAEWSEHYEATHPA